MHKQYPARALTIRQRSMILEAKHQEGCCLEGVPDLRRGLLGDNGGLIGAMAWRIAVYLQLSICVLSTVRPPSSLICICFLGDTGDGDTILSPSPSTGKERL